MKWLIAALLALPAWTLVRTRRPGEPLIPGQAAPDFNLADQSGAPHRLRDYAGKWLVLYFYPKDDTPGCTREACAFRDELRHFVELGAQVIGISVDDSRSHARFAKKYDLQFPLLADEHGAVAARYGALLDLLIIKVARRRTFLIDPQGKVRKVYRKVAPSAHARELIDDLQRLLSPEDQKSRGP